MLWVASQESGGYNRGWHRLINLIPRFGLQSVKRINSNVLWVAAQGELEITTEAGTGKAKEPNAAGQATDVVDRVPFLFLGLDLPPAPLYKDVMETNIIPQACTK